MQAMMQSTKQHDQQVENLSATDTGFKNQFQIAVCILA